MAVNNLDVSRRLACMGLLAGAASTLLPSRSTASESPQSDVWKRLTLVRRDGTRFTLNDVRAGVVVTALWGSFCGVCRRELPALTQLEHMFGDGGVGVVLVSHPEFWNDDYAMATQLGFAANTSTVASNTSSRLLETAFDMDDGALTVPQSLVYARAGGELSLTYSKRGMVNWQDPDMLASLGRQVSVSRRRA